MTKLEFAALSERFENRSPTHLLEWAGNSFGEQLAIVTSFQAEGMVLLDMAHRLGIGLRIMTIDTGRLHAESYSFMDQVREQYGIEIEVYFPDAADLREMVTQKGVNLFYQDVESRIRCCQVRKVNPLRNALKSVAAWMTGVRREQALTRSNIQKITLDLDYAGIVKLNPLADWTSHQVWDYIKENGVLIHPLYAKGYKSIGCAPCTRPVQAGEDDRAGRWWWENGNVKECGIHCKL